MISSFSFELLQDVGKTGNLGEPVAASYFPEIATGSDGSSR